MSRGIHLFSGHTPGLPSDGRCIPCSGVSGRAFTVSSYSSHGDYKPSPQVKNLMLKNPVYASRGTSLACSASSSSHRRNPDFSRQNKHGFSRSRNRPNQEKESSESPEESELLSKNGPILSSSTPKFQATATPGPREKEIVELFRKVQAQLRERAAIKEEKKIEASQGQGRESETVDSLLKLLRKHSVEQGKRRISSGGSKDFTMDQPEQISPNDEEQNTSFFDSSSIVRNGAPEPNAPSFTRPVSNFRRKSPVPRVKYQPIYSTEDSISSHSKSQGKQKKFVVEPEPEPELEPESEPEPEPKPEPEPVLDGHEEVFDGMYESESSDIDEAYSDEVAEEKSSAEHMDLSALKLPELRVLAKSRGMKGFSKLKKAELVELLSRGSI